MKMKNKANDNYQQLLAISVLKEIEFSSEASEVAIQKTFENLANFQLNSELSTKITEPIIQSLFPH